MSRLKIKKVLPRSLWPKYDALGMWAADILYRRLYAPKTRIALGTLKRASARKVMRSRRPFCIDIQGLMGLGAVVKHMLALHHAFDGNPGFKRIISSRSLYLPPGEEKDMVNLYFDRLDEQCVEDCAIIPFDCEYDIQRKPLTEGLTIEHAHTLFNRHYKVKQRFVDEAESFLGPGGKRVLGVHYRSGDKRQEAPRIAWERYAETVDALLDHAEMDSIFVATDELAFVHFMEERYGGGKVRALDCNFLSLGPLAAHFKGGDEFEKGREALLTALILSRCGVLVRGHSFLSALSKILSPEMPVIMLGEPYPPIPFPEVQIMRESEGWQERLAGRRQAGEGGKQAG